MNLIESKSVSPVAVRVPTTEPPTSGQTRLISGLLGILGLIVELVHLNVQLTRIVVSLLRSQPTFNLMRRNNAEEETNNPNS